MARDWTGYKKFEPAWTDSACVRKVVREELVGNVLVFPSGRSPLGDVTADVDVTVCPDVRADVTACPFKPRSFDTVYADPPYDLYHNSHEWIEDLWAVAREKLILQTPNARILLSGAKKRYILIEPTPGSAQRWVITLQIFEPENETLPV